MTIKDFAKIAGVSVSTISKIMNNKDKSISAETREHVLKLAKEYNYSPGKSMLPGRKTLALGLVLKSGQDINMMLGGMISAAGNMGYSLILKSSENSFELEKKNLLSLININVDGILWESVSKRDADNEDILRKSSLPYIKLLEKNNFPLNIDFKNMGYIATQALLDKNHTEIGCFLGNGKRTKDFLEGY